MKIENKNFILVIILFFSTLFLRLWFVIRGNFLFTWDFGRDMLWVRQLTVQHKFILVGPWGSLDGAFFGPLYYYFLSIPLYLFTGDPRAAVGMVAFLTSLLIIISYFFGKSLFDKKTGIIFALLFTFLSIFMEFSLYSFSQNVIPFFYLLFIISQWKLIKKVSGMNIFLSCMLASLFFHFEPVDTPPAILIVLGIVLYLWKKKKIKKLAYSLACAFLGFITPFAGNIIFDIRHGYPQLSAFQRFFSGQDQSLHGKQGFLSIFLDRWMQFIRVFWETFTGIQLSFERNSFINIASFFILLTIIFILHKRGLTKKFFNQKNNYVLFFSLTIFNIFVFFCYFLLFTPALKNYYLFMLPVLYVLLIGALLSYLYKYKFVSRRVLNIFLLLIIFVNIYPLFTGKYTQLNNQSYFLQKSIVEKIYQLAENKPFEVYVYTPEIYDYPYQYFFSWFGNKSYGYIPAEYAYLPEKPEYVLNKEYFDIGKKTNLKNNEFTGDIFLIVGPGKHMFYKKDDWLRNFSQKDIVFEHEFPGNIVIKQIRHFRE